MRDEGSNGCNVYRVVWSRLLCVFAMRAQQVYSSTFNVSVEVAGGGYSSLEVVP